MQLKDRSIAIVPLSRKHIPACKRIVRQSAPWDRLGEGLPFSRFLDRRRSLLHAYACVVCGDIAGFLVILPRPVFARGGYLRAIAVASAYRRRGIGSLLLAFAERSAATRCSCLYLCVSAFNRQARTFYRRRGYLQAGRLPDLVRKGEAELIFWKRLKSAAGARRKR